jgi:hypothetical protein
MAIRLAAVVVVRLVPGPLDAACATEAASLRVATKVRTALT